MAYPPPMQVTGKAQEVVSSLWLKSSLNYKKVKECILCTCEFVPEAHCQTFRSHKKGGKQTLVGFAREKVVLFNRWCTASEVKDLHTLRELVLLEDFNDSIADRSFI